MEQTPETTLYGKLAKIMGEVKHVPKNGKNEHFKYSFATEGDISDAIRKLLSEHNIAIFASMVAHEQKPSGNTIKTVCTFEFTLACGDSGATHSCLWTGEANDNQDKGYNKAATAAMKYWLLKTFMIPTGDDPDGASGEAPAPKAGKVSNAAPQQRPQKPATQTPPPPPAVPQAAETATPEPQRNARLENEELTITRLVKTGRVTGNPDPTKNGDRYDGWGKIVDGGTFDVRVWIYPEDVLKIKDHYEFPSAGGECCIQIIMDTTDRAMTRIGQVVPKSPENAAKTIVESFVVNLTQKNKPYLIFKYGDNYAYSYTRDPFRVAGYNVDGWDAVGNHEMPTPAELICEWDKQHKQLIVKKAVMVDQFAEAS